MGKSTILKREDGTGYIMVFVAEDSEAVAVGNGYDNFDNSTEEGQSDALARNGYAHTHTSADLTLKQNRTIAEGLGNLKEGATTDTTGVDNKDEYKDQYNNELGRKIGDWLKEFLEQEDQQGRHYTDEEKEKFLDDLICDADDSGAMIKNENQHDKSKDFDNDPASHQNPKDDVDWAAPSNDWQGKSQGRDYSNSDELNENPVGWTLDIPTHLNDFAKDSVGKLFDLPSDYGLAWDIPQAPLPLLLSWLAPIFRVPGFEFMPGSGVGGGLDPLVFDLDNSGAIDLISVENSTVNFDFWNDGFSEKTGWVAASDGMLVIDLDQNGEINGAAELFGSNLPLTYILEDNFSAFATEENGFARLETYDSNNDGVIDAQDDIWTELKIWQDLNQDGVSQPEELLTLDNIGISSIDVANYALDSFYGLANGGFLREIEGHTVTHSGFYTMADGSTREIADVWFNNNLQDSRFDQNFTLDVRTFFLPNVRGYGLMPDLFVAMSQDNQTGGLLDDVANFATSRTAFDFFSDFDAVRSEVGDILLKWAGVDQSSIQYQRHGLFEEMPEFAFLRTFAGQDAEYLGTWFDGTPFLPHVGDGVEAIYQSWNLALDGYAARLIFQSGGSELFEDGAFYDSVTDSFTNMQLSQTAIQTLETEASAHSDIEGFWHNFAAFINNTIGADQLSSNETIWISDAVENSSSNTLTWASILTTLDVNVIDGSGNADSINGTNYDDIINGNQGDDVLNGGAGNDRINANNDIYEADNDTLIGGAGNDILSGGRGNDTYVYESGHDVIIEQGGNFAGDTDIIVMEDEINVSDVSLNLARVDTGYTEHLFLKVENRGTITIQNDTAYWTTIAELVDEVHFQDGTILQLADMDITISGTDNDDTIGGFYGFTGDVYYNGYGGNDTININAETSPAIVNGGAGDDTINGSTTDDIYIISSGLDTISDTGGNDTIILPDGFTLDDIQFLRVQSDGAYSGYYNDASIVVNGLGTTTLLNAFLYDPTSGKAYETLQLSDGTTVDLTNQVYEVKGTAGDDYISDSAQHSTQLDDVYVFGQGNDVISEQRGGIDTIRFEADVTLSDITIQRSQLNPASGNNLIIKDQYGNSITVMKHFEYTNSDALETNHSIEKLEFADGTVINLTDIEIEAHGTESNDQIHGGATGDASNSDTIYGHGGNDYIYGNLGNDTAYGEAGDDYIYGDEGDDDLYGGVDNDTIYGGYGDDELFGEEGDDILYGEGQGLIYEGNDILSGGAGNDMLYGERGDDTYIYTAGFDTIAGENGYESIDTLSFATQVTMNNLYFWRSTVWADYYDLNIDVGSLGSIKINGQINGNNDDWNIGIENLLLSDGTIMNMRTINVAAMGTSDNDYLYGIDDGSAGANDTFYGYGGDDYIYGYGGNDTVIYSGSFTNYVITSMGSSLEVYDTTGNDGRDTVGDVTTLSFTDGTYDLASGIFTSSSSDLTFIGTSGADTFAGGAGSDTVNYSASALAVSIDLQNNVISGGDAQGDTLISIENIIGSNSSSARDYIWGNAGANEIYGMDGADILEGGAGADLIDGGLGWDYARYTRSNAGININMLTNMNTGGDAQGDTLFNIEAVVGSAHDDTIIGANGNDYLKGENGNDYLDGGLGSDQLFGGEGNDTYVFVDGKDTITEQGSGIDSVIFDAAWKPEQATISGNVLSFVANTHQISFNNITLIEFFSFDGFADMTLQDLINYEPPVVAGDDVFIGTSAVETFDGGDGKDSVDYSASSAGITVDLQNHTATTGDAQGDTLISIEKIIGSNTASVRDWVWGDANDNEIYGMAGDDILEGGAGADTIDGGAGWDYSRYLRSDAGVNINLETGINTGGHAQGDILIGIEAIVGSNYNDTLRGGNGNDYLKGEGGNDILAGGLGVDQLYGGAGADIFLFESTSAYSTIEKVMDFNLSQNDKIDLSDLLSGYNPLSQAITDFVRITDSGANSILAIDSNGGADNFVQIATLYSVTGLTDEAALETSGNLITV